MTYRILTILTLFGLLAGTSLEAQELLPQNPGTEQIRGTRLIPYPSYSGSPFLYGKFSPGEIEFTDGTKIAVAGLRYSSYRDELVYFNSTISSQIVIDKISLNGFAFTDENGVKRVFRRLYYDGFLPGNRYFEVLSDGNVSLLAWRKVELLICTTYADDLGRLKNMSYQEAYNFYLYSKTKGFELIRIGRNALLSKFDKPSQTLVKKILRKNKVVIRDETTFVKAWNLIKENEIQVNF